MDTGLYRLTLDDGGSHHSSSTYQSQLVEAARKRIDDEIAQLKQTIHILSRRRNGLAPANGLPAELLADIFTRNASAYDARLGEQDDLSWARVSHVCRYWRNAALETPRMWTRITVKSEPWTRLLLERTKNLPLVAHFDVPVDSSHPRMSGFRLLAMNSPRLRELTISFSNARTTLGTKYMVWDALAHPAPLLESFVIQTPFLDNVNGVLNNVPAHAPAGVFDGQFHSLWRVELHQCSWCWSTSLFCNTVTHLVLDGRCVSSQTPIHQIFSALDCMPMLEELELIHVTPPVPWDFDPRTINEPLVYLSRLSCLRIDELTLNCAAILFTISIPADTKLVLFCQPFMRCDEIRAIGAALTAKFDPQSTAEHRMLQSLSIETNATDTLQLNFWTDVLSLDELREASVGEALLQLNVEWEGMVVNTLLTTLMDACNTLPLSTVRAMYISDSFPLSVTAWLDMFGCPLRGLTELWVTGHSATHLPQALLKYACLRCHFDEVHGSTPEQEAMPHGKQPVLFPALDVLTLEEVDFSVDVQPGTNKTLWHLFEEVLNLRQEAGGCRRLSFIKCRNLVGDQIYDLSGRAEVTWDGEYLDFDLDEYYTSSSEEDYEEFYEREKDKEGPDKEHGGGEKDDD
ncbi:uncharacterized protein LAESUDRAFT_8622 [Laetiporus sulphureus 93-53]|uniref:F-box domain-containing protein n=1 Tax=Laetiporus sulphureus 93-53 TaxID=1314785 RepID=A0A165I5M3_9APHY|nr:uncharacterized protein LAESUDRAFT_8622 [Laetiporus sulphureus 93-53]KZT12621.1 hypothetical protein LAESUDRAFT_8622 [Laetiporus sulphureus 93-53]